MSELKLNELTITIKVFMEQKYCKQLRSNKNVVIVRHCDVVAEGPNLLPRTLSTFILMAAFTDNNNYILKCDVFGSFGLSTKEPYTIMLCASWSLASVLALASVHASPCYRLRHRNFIFGIHMHTYSLHMHIKYLVILTCSF